MNAINKKSPNTEQEIAIFHNGGKVLSAGAGSGKTYVLIEHLVYLLEQIKKRIASSDWEKSISSELSKIVLMTFTKKAAGEMSVRMMRRTEEAALEAEDSEDDLAKKFWRLVRQNLSYLNITTIHGFCHRILRLGFWGEFPQTVNLVSQLEHKDKIQKIFDKWFDEKKSILDPIFLAGTDALLVAMVEIFNSPELRVMWTNPQAPTSPVVEINFFFSELLKVKSYGLLFREPLDLDIDPKNISKKWYELLKGFSELIGSEGIISADNFLKFSEYFKSISRFPPSNGKELSDEQRKSILQIRELKDDLKELAPDLSAMMENFESYKKWVITIGELFTYIETHYFEVEGFSFADLEYYVLRALQVGEVLAKVQQSHTYFIVDEFQDTSYLQFEILKKLIGDKPEKLFCVGDRKQAIYGFRGGELQVFADCAKLLGSANNYFLKNNFRSFSSIIEFNNSLFELVFPLGLKFQGLDPHTVRMVPQFIPLTSQNSGEVVSLRTEILCTEGDEVDLDFLEAEVLASHIEVLLAREDIQSICVLYRKLAPSAYLLENLLKKDIAYIAQVKIQFSEDPLISIFVYLLEIYLNNEDLKKKESTYFLLETLLEIIQVRNYKRNIVEQFFNDLKIMGLRLSFYKFISSIGLTNSFHAQNASTIDAICRLTNEDFANTYHLLKNGSDDEYSCEMMSGEAGDGKKRIIIMSAHASKGLEFDAVLLGGIHTNGRYNGMKNQLGKIPLSFKWKKSFDQKRFFKSPFYHFEAEVLKLKDFSESKRLLYVACTRAVKHLAFANLWKLEKEIVEDQFSFENSWIHALRLVNTTTIHKQIKNNQSKKHDIALIQQDSLGLIATEKSHFLGLISELSVTRLASIADCPFKFYLQNICKIDPSLDFQIEMIDTETEFDIGVDAFYSSKKRGTQLHLYLSKLFLNEVTIDDLPLNREDKDKILWAFDLAKSYLNRFTVISEKLIKFNFFGQMISGTPDLVFTNSESVIVWDFKTGLRDSENEASYWFQLMCYGLGYAQSMNLTKDANIVISLLYLDQNNLVSKSFSLEQITQILFNFWKKTESLDQVNSHHCSSCDYSTICSKGKSSSLC